MPSEEANITWSTDPEAGPAARYLEIRLNNPHDDERTYSLYACSHEGLWPDRRIYRTRLAAGEWVHRTLAWSKSRNYSLLLTCSYDGIEEWFLDFDLRTLPGEVGLPIE